MTLSFDREKALAQWTGLQQLISAGAYAEREPDGSYGEDGVEESLDALELQAWAHGLNFIWHQEGGGYWTLEPMSEQERADYLVAHMFLPHLEIDAKYLAEQTPKFAEALTAFLGSDLHDPTGLRIANLRMVAQFLKMTCERIDGLLGALEDNQKKVLRGNRTKQ